MGEGGVWTPCHTDLKAGARDVALAQLLPDHGSVSLGLVLGVSAFGRPLFLQRRQGPAEKTHNCSCSHRRLWIALSTGPHARDRRSPLIPLLPPPDHMGPMRVLSCWNPPEFPASSAAALAGPSHQEATPLLQPLMCARNSVHCCGSHRTRQLHGPPHCSTLISTADDQRFEPGLPKPSNSHTVFNSAPWYPESTDWSECSHMPTSAHSLLPATPLRTSVSQSVDRP